MIKLTIIVPFLLFLTNCASTNNQEIKDKPLKQKKADLYYQHGTQALVERDYTQALDHLLKAVDLSPDSSKVHNNLGMAYFFKKQIPIAISHFKKAIELGEKNSDARNNLGGIYFKKGQYRLAEKEYKKVLQDLTYKHQYRTHYNLALIYEKIGNTNLVVNQLHKSIAVKKDYCPAQFKMGLVFQQNHRHGDAIETFRKATLGTCLNSPAPHYHQALSHMKLRQHERAFNKFKELIDQFPESGYARLATQKLREVKVNQLNFSRARSKFKAKKL